MKNSAIKNQYKMKTIQTLKSIFALSLITLFTIFLYSCGKSGSTEKPETPVAAEHAQVASEVTVNKQQYDALKIQMGSIEKKNLVDVLKATGFLRVPPQNKANITSVFGGTVKNIVVQEGKHVSKGQTVLTLTNPEFIKMQEEYLDVKSQLAFAETEYNRQKELSIHNVASQKTFQQVESTSKSLKAKFNSLKQQLMLLGINTSELTEESITSVINVVSPINGSVCGINVNIGTNAEVSKILMDVVDNSRLHLDLFVFEQDLPKIKEGQTIDFSLTNLPGKSYSATIFSIGSAFENETKTIPLHAEITGNKEGLIEGMNVTGSVNIGRSLVPAIPSAAIASFSGNDYIFIAVQQNQKEEKEGIKFVFRRIHIKKGITNAGYSEVTPLEEIPADAKVVISGAFYLMAMLTNTGEEE
jgi:RND family efflux transporter MFP subunit